MFSEGFSYNNLCHVVIGALTACRKHIVGKHRVSKIAVLDGQIQLFCGRKPEMNKRQHLCRIIHVSCLQPTAALKAAMDGQHRPTALGACVRRATI